MENMFITNTHDDLLFFTNFGKVYSIKGYEVPEAQKTARGRAIVNLLQLGDGEKVTTVIPRKGKRPRISVYGDQARTCQKDGYTGV